MNYKQVDVLVSRISVYVLERWLRVGVGGQRGEGGSDEQIFEYIQIFE